MVQHNCLRQNASHLEKVEVAHEPKYDARKALKKAIRLKQYRTQCQMIRKALY